MADVRHALMDADKSAKLKPQIAIPRKAAPDRSFPDVIYSAAPHERSSANTARTGFHHHSAYNRAAAPLVRSRARVFLYELPLVGLPTLRSLDARHLNLAIGEGDVTRVIRVLRFYLCWWVHRSRVAPRDNP
jgi:hypothetical protein